MRSSNRPFFPNAHSAPSSLIAFRMDSHAGDAAAGQERGRVPGRDSVLERYIAACISPPLCRRLSAPAPSRACPPPHYHPPLFQDGEGEVRDISAAAVARLDARLDTLIKQVDEHLAKGEWRTCVSALLLVGRWAVGGATFHVCVTCCLLSHNVFLHRPFFSPTGFGLLQRRRRGLLICACQGTVDLQHSGGFLAWRMQLRGQRGPCGTW